MNKEINVVSVSGGADSTALYLLAIEFYGSSFLPIFADTGHEHPVTVNYVRNLHLLSNGPKVVIVKSSLSEPTDNPYLNLALKKKRFPSAKAQFCTEWLKLAPILFYLLKNYPREHFTWIMHTGIVATESAKRSKMQPFMWNDYFNCITILPLLYESKEKLKIWIRNKGLFLNPLYTLGNCSRVGCYPCIYAKKEELANLEDWAWDRLFKYEKITGSTFFAPNMIPGKGIKTAQMVKNWASTSWGGKKYELFSRSNQNVKEDIPSCVSGFIECGS